MRFRNRSEAGRQLAGALEHHKKDAHDAVILALPRGGVPVAYEVSRALNLPLDVFIVRKLGVPGYEELAMGAIASGGLRVLNTAIIDELRIPQQVIDAVARREEHEHERRERLYGDGRPPYAITNRTSVILVDDGLATGSTMKAAVAALRLQNPARIVVAVPIAPPETCRELQRQADEVICAVTPEPFYAVGQWYEDFAQTTDEEVTELITRAA